MPEIDFNFFNRKEQETQQTTLLSGIEVFQDKEGNQYTKQRLFESIIGMYDGSMFGGNVNGNWLSAVEQMGKWYEANIHTYQGRTAKPWDGKHWYMCPLINDKVADDCSGFVQSCIKLFGIDCPVITTAMMQDGSQFDKLMEASGFTHHKGLFTPDNLQPGDIICGRASTHTEIYAGDRKSWSWGSIHDGQNGHSGMPAGFCKIDSRGGYIHCWRKS